MIRLMVFLILLSACGSPRNNRVTGGLGTDQKVQSQKIFVQKNIKVVSYWAQGPYGTVTQKSFITVYLYNQNDELVSLQNGEELGFYAVMPSMGHGLDQPGFFEELAPGIYINRNITFNMPGDWEMRLWIMDAQGNMVEEIRWLEVF